MAPQPESWALETRLAGVNGMIFVPTDTGAHCLGQGAVRLLGEERPKGGEGIICVAWPQASFLIARGDEKRNPRFV